MPVIPEQVMLDAGHRDTERSIVGAGFEVDTARREWTLPMWAPLPMSELALGRARRPA